MSHRLSCILVLVTCLSMSLPRASQAKVVTPPAETTPEVTMESAEPGQVKESSASQPVASQRTYTVSPQKLTLKEKLDGVFVSKHMSEIVLWPESWTDFKIKTVVPHGSQIQVGQTLVEFDSADLERTIADLEVEQHLSELKLLRSEQDLPLLQQRLERELADARENMRRVQEDEKRYRDKERQQAIEGAEWNLRFSRFALEFAQEELDQLEKMYEADDLTEDTEEIILKRQRFDVEYATYRYEQSQYSHKIALDQRIPRQDRDLAVLLQSVEANLKRAELASQFDLSTARYELEKSKAERKSALEKHVKLLADRQLLTLKAPQAGIVYYGECNQGKWSKVDDMRRKLLPNKTVDKGTVIMTVVDSGALFLEVRFDEKLFPSIHAGQNVQIQLTAEVPQPLDASIESISATPDSEGKFLARIRLTSDLPKWLLPGMTAEATVVVQEKADALLVPKKALHTDELSEESYVLRIKEGVIQKTSVKPGKSKGDFTEILSGLQAGDVVSLDDEKLAAE